jgi:hypothetical protein
MEWTKKRRGREKRYVGWTVSRKCRRVKVSAGKNPLKRNCFFKWYLDFFMYKRLTEKKKKRRIRGDWISVKGDGEGINRNRTEVRFVARHTNGRGRANQQDQGDTESRRPPSKILERSNLLLFQVLVVLLLLLLPFLLHYSHCYRWYWQVSIDCMYRIKGLILISDLNIEESQKKVYVFFPNQGGGER